MTFNNNISGAPNLQHSLSINLWGCRPPSPNSGFMMQMVGGVIAAAMGCCL